MEARIERVEVRVFRTLVSTEKLPGGHLHPCAPRPVEAALLAVRDVDGVEGYCLCGTGSWSQGATGALRESVKRTYLDPVLVGEDAFLRERIWKRLAALQRSSKGALTDQALSYVDQALWDLAGRKCDLPVWKLLGGARASVPAYASTMCGDDPPGGLGDPSAYARFARQLVEMGYRAIKLHTWMPAERDEVDLARDIAACAAVREAVGPGMVLMLDAYHYCRRSEALALGRAIEALDYTWFEEPMEEASIASYRWLSAELDIAVLGPESAPGKVHTRGEWIAARACDLLRVGVNDVGGITPARKIAHLAEAFGLGVEVHGGGSGNLALLGGTGVGHYYERGMLHPEVDYDAAEPHLGSIVDPLQPNGEVPLPERPGLGDDLRLDYIAEHHITSW